MRKRFLSAAALLCGASLAHAQGFAGTSATGVPLAGFFANQGYQIGQMSYSPEYAAYLQQAQYQAAMAGYAGAGYPGGMVNYGYPPGYGYGYPVAAPNPAMSGGTATATGPAMPAGTSGIPVMSESTLEATTGDLTSGRNHLFWINADYTMTWIQPQKLPYPLVTFGASTDTRPGALGQPGTSIFIGDSLDQNRMDGVKIDTGFFIDSSRTFSLEWVGHLYSPSNLSIVKTSDADGVPLIARPINSVVTGAPAAFIDSTPGGVAGGVAVDSKTSLFRTEFNVGCNAAGERWSGAAIFGLRYMRLSESLTIRDQLNPLVDNFILFNGTGVLAGETVNDIDSFRTRNTFYGGQVGGRFRWDGNWVFVSGYGKVGLGVTDQKVEIGGVSMLSRVDGTQASLPGGILALPSNIGSRTRTVFSYSPEAGLNIGLKLTQHLALSAGYSFTYWSHVVRPGRQIDSFVNPTQVVTDNSYGATAGPTRPVFTFNDEDVFLHTLSLGLQLQY